MPSWTDHKVEIYGYGSTFTIGPLVGTITRILENGAEGDNNLDEEGRGSFKIHGADTPSLSLCQEYRIARVVATSSVSAAEHEICCFIIREIKPEIKGRQVIVTVSGPGLLAVAKWGNIGFNVISDGAGGPSTTPIEDALAHTDKAWTVTTHGVGPSEPHGTTLSEAVLVGSGESAYVALVTLLQQMNAHMSLALIDNPDFTLHIWYGFSESSGITLLETEDPASYQADTTTAVITQPITVTKEPQEVFTRAYIYGAGMGVDRRTIAEAEGLVPSLPLMWEVNYSESWVRNRNLEEDGHPFIWTTKGFPAYEPEDPEDEFSVQTNAIGLLYAAITWLKHRSQSIITYYEIRDLIIHADIIPGQLVHVTYNRSSPVNSSGSMVTTEIIDLDDDLIVLGIQHRIGPGGIRYTNLLVGDTPKRPSTGLNMMAEKLKDLEETIRHTNAGSGSSGPPTGNPSYLLATGSGPILSGDLLVEPLVTIDGIDISAHAADGDAHHVPGTISATSSNFNNGTETHAVDASSDPGVQTYLLKTNEDGQLILFRIDLDSLVLTDRTTLEKHNIFLNNGKMFIEPI